MILLSIGVFLISAAVLSLCSGQNIGFTAGGNHAGRISWDSNPLEFSLVTIFQLIGGILTVKSALETKS
jgi:hypothetical protein